MAQAQGSSNTRNTQGLETEKLEHQSKSKSSDVLHQGIYSRSTNGAQWRAFP